MEKVKKDGEIVRETAKAAVVHGGRKVLLIAAGAVIPVRQREDNLTDVSAAERPDFSGGSRGSLKAFAQELVNLTTKEVRALAEILKEEYGIVSAEPLIIEESPHPADGKRQQTVPVLRRKQNHYVPKSWERSTAARRKDDFKPTAVTKKLWLFVF